MEESFIICRIIPSRRAAGLAVDAVLKPRRDGPSCDTSPSDTSLCYTFLRSTRTSEQRSRWLGVQSLAQLLSAVCAP